MFNKRRHFRLFDGIPKMLSNRAYIRAFIKNKLRVTVLWSWKWPFSMIFVNILPNDGISKDTVKNIKNTVTTIKNTVKPSIPLRSSSNTPKRTQHNMPDDGILQNAWRYFSWTRNKKNSAFRCVEKIRSNLKKNEKCCHGKNAVFFEILSWRYFCIFFIEISYAKTKMLSKNVVIDGIMEYVDGILILSGGSGRTSGRAFGRPNVRPGVRPDVRLGVRPDVRPDVRAARVSSAAPKKRSFDRGGPVWPPRSNVTNDRLRGGFAPPNQKPAGLGAVPPS